MASSESEKAWQRKYRSTEKGKAAGRRATKDRYYRYKKALSDIKSARGCLSCGFSNPHALDFHHRDPATKKFNLRTCDARARSMDVVLKEIEKCDVLCANCHRIEHAK